MGATGFAAATVPAAPRLLGDGTLVFERPPHVIAAVTLAGSHEAKGPLAQYVDGIVDDDMMGQDTPEKAERALLAAAVRRALAQAALQPEDITFFIAGDLMNQITSSTLVARDVGIPHLGLFSACAVSGQALGLAAALLDGGFAQRVMVGTCSHYQSAERQYRFPIELNRQLKDTNQWTATGAAAAILAQEGEGPRITAVTFGKVVDFGLSDPNDMGSIMAPAANDTLLRHWRNTNTGPQDYDLILTGDLGRMGQKMLHLLLRESDVTLGNKHEDCGAMLYSPEQTYVKSGGSGAACSMLGMMGYALRGLKEGRYKRVLALPTGCLHSPVTVLQGETCPAVCHAVVLEA